MNKTTFIAQVIISFFMAIAMSGTLSAIMLGINAQWLANWPRAFIMSWPVAFIYAQLIGPFAFWAARKLTAKTSA